MSELGVQVSAAQPASSSGAEEALMVMRLRRGVVGESRRVSHIVPVPDGAAWPEQLTALCGARITGRHAEVLTGVAGMPCVHCVSRLPVYETLSARPA